jgi:hypothetical protein
MCKHIKRDRLLNIYKFNALCAWIFPRASFLQVPNLASLSSRDTSEERILIHPLSLSLFLSLSREKHALAVHLSFECGKYIPNLNGTLRKQQRWTAHKGSDCLSRKEGLTYASERDVASRHMQMSCLSTTVFLFNFISRSPLLLRTLFLSLLRVLLSETRCPN